MDQDLGLVKLVGGFCLVGLVLLACLFLVGWLRFFICLFGLVF